MLSVSERVPAPSWLIEAACTLYIAHPVRQGHRTCRLTTVANVAPGINQYELADLECLGKLQLALSAAAPGSTVQVPHARHGNLQVSVGPAAKITLALQALCGPRYAPAAALFQFSA